MQLSQTRWRCSVEPDHETPTPAMEQLGDTVNIRPLILTFPTMLENHALCTRTYS